VPELPLSSGGSREAERAHGVGADEREPCEDDANHAGRTVRTLEIGELDERYRRPGPTESRTALRNTLRSETASLPDSSSAEACCPPRALRRLAAINAAATSPASAPTVRYDVCACRQVGR
jgi:hypothetical protein